MKNKITWLIVTICMVAALLVASCAPAVTEEEEAAVQPPEEEETAVPPTEEEVVAGEKEMVQDALGRLVEKPKYGGEFIFVRSSAPSIFDDCLGHPVNAPTIYLTNEELRGAGWEKGPAGTGDDSHLYVQYPPEASQTNILCESWERPDPLTLVFHIRKGVYWHDKPPTSGRELTADDVAFSIERILSTPGSFLAMVHPPKDWIESIEVTDKYTVVVKIPYLRNAFGSMADHTQIFPRDMVEEHGNMKDWENSCGTGPFLLVDYVPGSSVTFDRNPNYWRKHPMYPEDTMPYLDSIKWLIIPDLSTRLAAMRTGKVDHLAATTWEDADSLKKTNPELKYLEYNSAGGVSIFLRCDKPELPTYDIRVRRALAMAVDNQLILDTYYGGRADMLAYPTADIPSYKNIFIPLDELPESNQELYEYHPDKAKQLLAEAGYPDGFRMEVLCTYTQVDVLSIVKAQWEEIGVNLELDVKEPAVWVSTGFTNRYKEHFCYVITGSVATTLIYVWPGTLLNFSIVDDPFINEAYEERRLAGWEEDYDKADQLFRDLTPYLIDQSHMIVLPAAHYSTFWQPWVKEYHGELHLGFMGLYNFQLYIWLDQDLKEEMTGRR